MLMVGYREFRLVCPAENTTQKFCRVGRPIKYGKMKKKEEKKRDETSKEWLLALRSYM